MKINRTVFLRVVVQSGGTNRMRAVAVEIPYLDTLAGVACNEQRQPRMKNNGENSVRVSLQGADAGCTSVIGVELP